jgi:cytochrome c oxidase assembly protein Cox11
MTRSLHDAAGCLALLVSLGGFMGCGGSVTGSQPFSPVPSITSFAASPTTMTDGRSATLTGVFANGTSVITPGNLAATSGSPVTVTPSATTTYTLTVTNLGGTAVTATASVTVVPAPTIASFTASPPTVTTGRSATLTGVFASGTGVITPGNLAVTSGNAVTVTPSATTVYTLTVTNLAGTAITSTATVTVVPAPTLTSFTASPATITAGSSSSLRGVFANGTGVVTPGNLTVTSGNAVNVSPSTTTTYTLTVTNAAGTAVTATVKVTVDPAPTIASFTASPTLITAGRSATLTGVFANGTGVITPGNLAATSGTAVSVSPSSTTTYTLTVTNPAGTAITATATVTVDPAPTIASFTANPTSIAAGEPSSLVGVFAHGTGVITPGNLTVTSGNAVSVTPSATTIYTLTVTNPVGTAVTASTTVTVTPALSASANLGINISWVTDWDPTQMFADAMKQARKFGSVAKPYDETANVDAQGWPTQDAGVVIIDSAPNTVNQLGWMVGNYALSFTGQADVQKWDDPDVSVGAVTYDSATNTSTATVTVSAGFQQLGLIFTNTQRTPTSPMGSGITNVSLMRPMMNGSPHPPGTLFTDRFLNRLKYFTALRMMDYLETNSSTEEAWTDRAIPADASQQEVPPHTSQNVANAPYVTGGSYEYAIQLANQTGKDLWLNIPHLAFGGTYQFTSTTWATNLALLLKYGSDAGGNPYTGLNGSTGSNPQPASGPVNPPLDSGLHVYIEWSNEFFSGAGDQTAWIQQQAQNAITARNPDLDWDNDNTVSDLEWRINAKGVMLIANAFASVFGSSDFGTVYRPIYAGQIAGDGTYTVGLNYLQTQHGGASQYVWAVAGAPYDDFNGDTPGNTITADQIVGSGMYGMPAYQTTYVEPWVGDLAAVASTYSLQGGMVAYEGGQGAQNQTSGAMAAQLLPAMRGITTTLLDNWFAQGGGPFFYYKLCSADTWGLDMNISYDIDADSGYNTDTEEYPKWGAIKQVSTTGN